MRIKPTTYKGLTLGENASQITRDQYKNAVSSLSESDKKLIDRYLDGEEGIHDKMNDDLKSLVYELAWFHSHLIDGVDNIKGGMTLPANKNYFVTQGAMEIAQTLNVDNENFHLSFLEQLPTKKSTIMPSPNLAIRWMRYDDILYVCIHEWKPTTELSQEQLQEMYQRVGGERAFKKRYGEPLDHHWEWFFAYFNTGRHYVRLERPQVRLAIQLISFIELGDTEIKYLEPNGGKTGKTRKYKVINDSSSGVHIVDANWNVITVRDEPFMVRGHYRWQPYGEGLTKAKYIWIKPFVKKGYVRKQTKN